MFIMYDEPLSTFISNFKLLSHGCYPITIELTKRHDEGLIHLQCYVTKLFDHNLINLIFKTKYGD